MTLNLFSKQERQILRGPQKYKSREKEKALQRECLGSNKIWDEQPMGRQHTKSWRCSWPGWAGRRKPHIAHVEWQNHQNHDRTREERRTQVEERQRAGETEWRRVGGTCNVSCRDLGEDEWAPGNTQWAQRTGKGETHLNHRNKPLTLRFSGSTVFKQIKKQGKG